MIKRANELSPAPKNLPESADQLTREKLDLLLREMWGEKIDDVTAAKLIDMTWEAFEALNA